MSKKIVQLSNETTLIHNEIGVFAFTTGTSTIDMNDLLTAGGYSWESAPAFIGGKRIVSYGINNEMPVLIRRIMDENNLAPGILEREIGLLHGDGPQLYTLVIENNQVKRLWRQDKEVSAWLKTWDFRRYLTMAVVEYKYMKGFFVKRYLSRGSRLGTPRVAKLEVVPNTHARLEYAWSQKLCDVKHIFVGDFEHNCYKSGIATYPVYDTQDPARYKVSASYHNSYSFARNFYSLPSYYGSLKWIMRSSDIPDIIKYLTDNGIAVAYHVHSPAQYWRDKEEKLREKYPDKPDSFIKNEFDKMKTNFFTSVSEVLAGKKNVGKFIETIDFVDDLGNTQSWKIEPIDQKVKDFIDAQLKIAEKADSATTSGLGLHPSLSNIIVGGQLASGSQMLYALKLYLASDISIAEEVIFEAINQAIEVNFPGRELRMGFYHKVVMTEDNVNPEDRVKSNI